MSKETIERTRVFYLKFFSYLTIIGATAFFFLAEELKLSENKILGFYFFSASMLFLVYLNHNIKHSESQHPSFIKLKTNRIIFSLITLQIILFVFFNIAYVL